MQKPSVKVFHFLCVVVFAGCSQIQFISGIEDTVASGSWTSRSPNDALAYSDSSFSFDIEVYASPNDNVYNTRFITFGPPLIPIIPNPSAWFESDHIHVALWLLSNPDSLVFDPSRIYLILEGRRDSVLHPTVSIGSSDRFALSFELPGHDVNKCSIVFNDFVQGQSKTTIPDVTFTRWARYRWVWVFLPLN